MNKHPLNHPAILRIAAVAMLVLAAGCGTTQREQSPYVEVPAGSFAQAWSADLKLGRDKVVALTRVGELLIVQTENNTAFGLSADGGTLRWSTQVLPPGRTVGRPALAGNRVVFPTTDELIVYSMQGRREREVSLNRAIRSAIVGDGDYVYVGFDYIGQGRLGRVSLGESAAPVRWELMTRGAVSAAPAVFQEVIYSGSEDGNVYAVTDQRVPIWATPGNVFATGSPIVADLKADDTGVYVASTDSKLYALDRLTGKIRWQFYAGPPLRTAPFVTDDSVYQFVPGRGVVALDKIGGAYNREPRWVAESAVQTLAQEGQRVYLRGGDNSIIAVDRRTGKQLFRSTRRDLRVFAQNPAGPLVFAATPDGLVMAIKAVTDPGTTGQLAAEPNSPPLGG